LTHLQQSFLFGVPAKEPTDDDTKAAKPPRRNLVIEAGAGTGKTTAIVAEVLKLLLGDEELEPERIVLVTFTEKAAGEIADRIHHALTEIELLFDSGAEVSWPAGSPQPLFEVDPARREAARRACTRQLAQIDGLRSQTIHSFCQSLLRQFPLEARLDPQFKIVEGFERSLLHSELYDAWLDRETRLDPTPEKLRDWETLIEHVNYLFLIREILFELVERRDLLLDPRYDTGDIAEVEGDVVAALNVVRAFAAPETAALAEYVARHSPPLGGGLDTWIEYLLPITAEIRAAKLPRKKDQLMLANAIRELRSGDSGDAITDRLLGHRAALAAHNLAMRLIAFLEEEKRRRGVVDFDDLLIRTDELLRDDTIAERIRAQFDYLFVDEFQDTDRVQARIIDRLARDAAGALVAGRTVVVGDPKQSIYGFRRADPETYHRFTEALIEGGAEKKLIVDQYRSEPALLEAVNGLFARLFPPQLAHDPNVFRPEYHALTARRKAVHDGEPLQFLDVECDDRKDRQSSEGEAIAAWIAERRHEEGGHDGLRRFAILFRRTTYLDDYLDALDRAGIAYVLPPTKLFLDRRAPVDLLAVHRAIAFPFDRGAEISAARTPYFALTDDEIVERVVEGGAPPSFILHPSSFSVAEGKDEGSRMKDEGPSAWDSYHSALTALRDASRHMTVSQLIDHVIAATNIEAVYAAAADGERSLRHIEHVRAIAFEYDQTAGGSVRQFVDEITRRRHDPDEMEPSLVDEAQDAVRILTVHAAKGLEFETVILPDLDFNLNPPEAFTTEEPPALVLRGQVETLTSTFRKAAGVPLKDVAKQREEEETKRLFYVAVTRARREVLLVTSSGAKKQGFMKFLEAADGTSAGRKAERGKAERESPSSLPAFPLSPSKRLRNPELAQQLAEDPLAPFTPPLPPPTPPAPRPRAKARTAGILLHRVLERWDGRTPVAPLLERLAAEQGADRATTNKVRQRLAVVAQSPTLQRIAAAETLGREMPLAIAGENGVVLERRIDRWLREPAGNDLVVDYKSGLPDEKDIAQVVLYCRALSTMTGRPCRGLLWYIGVDEDHAVEVLSPES
jgi:ATP-dependent helicase/nuclease subunit A